MLQNGQTFRAMGCHIYTKRFKNSIGEGFQNIMGIRHTPNPFITLKNIHKIIHKISVDHLLLGFTGLKAKISAPTEQSRQLCIHITLHCTFIERVVYMDSLLSTHPPTPWLVSGNGYDRSLAYQFISLPCVALCFVFLR